MGVEFLTRRKGAHCLLGIMVRPKSIWEWRGARGGSCWQLNLQFYCYPSELLPNAMSVVHAIHLDLTDH